jgi:hypothetical protein
MSRELKPAVSDERALAFAMRLKVLSKDKVARENWSMAADALFGQDFIIVEIFDYNATD